MSSSKVLVFGPTGGVGSVTAVVAQEKGAKVFLAMRDPSKSIRGLSAEQERAGGFERVKADMTDVASVKAAAEKTGAKHAFIYLAHEAKDHMLATFRALREGGVTFVVFLSSFTVDDKPLAEIPATEVIPYVHARAEMSLISVFGDEAGDDVDYVALRPGAFSTNTLSWAKRIRSGENPLRLQNATYAADYITPLDMGRVAGSLLARGPSSSKEVARSERNIYLLGPKFTTQADAVALIDRVIFGGKENVSVKEVNADEAVETLLAGRYPPPIAKYLVRVLAELKGDGGVSQKAWYPDAITNVTKFAGTQPTTFPVWLEDNKDLYQ